MNVRLQYQIAFTAGVFYQDQMRMNDYNLRLWLMTNTNDAENHDISLARLKYFIYNQIDSSIIINQQCVEQANKYVSAGLRVTTMPGEPMDQLVGIMLFHKLNAIMEERMIVLETEISSGLGDNMIYMHSENENTDSIVCPDWWSSTDVSHNQLSPADGDKIFAIHPLNYAVWNELDLAWPEHRSDPVDGNTIVFANFQKDETK
jgi:hypothetical protein